MVKFAFLLASTALVAMPAAAQPTEPPGEIVTGAQAAAQVDHLHDEESSAIVVTGHAPGDLDILAGKSVLSGADLVRNLKPPIGDTLAGLPGLPPPSFSPGASRPVLPALQGARVPLPTDAPRGLRVPP